MIRRFSPYAAIFFIFCIACAAQRSQRKVSPETVIVRVSFDDAKDMPPMLRVQLLTALGSLISENFVSNQGQVTFPNVYPGNYELHLFGPGVEDLQTSFSLNAYDSFHSEFLHPTRKPVNGTQGSTEARISTNELNIPEKARREFDKAVALMQKPDFPQARKHLLKAVSLYPPYASAYNNLGVIAMKTGDVALGKSFFDRAISEDSSNGGAYVNLAKIKMSKNDFAGAQALLLKSVSLMPLDPEALTLLADTQMTLGEFPLALANAQKVHTVPHKSFAACHLIAAHIYLHQNLPRDAAAEYKTYLQEAPESPNAPQVRAALQSIEKKIQ